MLPNLAVTSNLAVTGSRAHPMHRFCRPAVPDRLGVKRLRLIEVLAQAGRAREP